MSKTVVCFALIVAWVGVSSGAPLAPDSGSVGANLCLWLRMPEVTYDPATGIWTDLSPKGNDASVVDGFVGPTLSAGENAVVFAQPFSTVHFDPGAQDLLMSTDLNSGAGLMDMTIFHVVKVAVMGGPDPRGVGFGAYQDGVTANCFNPSFDMTLRKNNGFISGKNQDLPLDTYVIYAARMNASSIDMWLNTTGTLELAFTASGSSFTTDTDVFYVGDMRYSPGGDVDIAEVVVFNSALTDEQVAGVSEWLQASVGTVAKTAAAGAIPAHEAIDVLRDTVLSWNPVATAVKRDVYFGTVLEDVNTADAANPLDVLVSQGQTATTYDPGTLELGQTYYWRVDEVNKAPDNTVFRGDVWAFEVEPVAIPIDTPIIATASGSNPAMEPSKTVDGSGLNELDQHSTVGTDMWLALTDGSWIQYEFGKVYKLHEMLVWNSNQVVETFIGFGVKEAVVETSLDGVTWTTVEGVPPFAKATAQATYTANTTVDLGGVVAKYVKITPQNAHGLTGQSGLSEVRFSYIPTDARELLPADGSMSASAEVALSWRAGREAASHEVYLGVDAANLALVGTTDDPSFVAEGLDYAQTYNWQIVEVNDAETPATYASAILSFATPAYGTVDDFESYSGDQGEEVFMAWFDGFGGDASLGGSTTGHIDGPFVETTNVYDGGQSMPIYIDNDGGFFDIDGKASSPAFSEVVRELDSQDWTAGGVKTLSIMFAGSPGLTGQLYCKINSTKLTYDGDASAIGVSTWQAWNIDLSTVSGNLANVRELAIGVDGGSSGILYIDAIRLYPRDGEILTPVMPDPANLVALWRFDEGSGTVAADSSGHGYDGAIQDAPWNVGVQGSALSFTAIAYVETAYPGIIGTGSRTCCAWIKTLDADRTIMSWGLNTTGNKWRMRLDVTGGLRVEVNGGYHYGRTYLADDEWHHTAVVLADDGTPDVLETALYVDGLPEVTAADLDEPIDTDPAGVVRIGKSPYHDSGFIGLIDDARIYDRALSPAEIAGLAGKTSTVHLPF